ncbi:hypothetical protein ACLI09_06245 [Flavobacterium sp. RHBU_24]|uniref:hypothetical protein n=1 Tax=Flavobacterium sp. RHBU_24 TaxID=3391185 RepID=UPI0039847FB9
MEITGLIVGIIGVIVAIATYNRQFNQPPPVFEEPEPIAEKNNLKVHFQMTKKLSLEVQNLIQKHIDKGNANRMMFEGITFQQYLNMQKAEFDKCFSDELYNNIDLLPYSKQNIESMLNSINGQFGALQQMKYQMELL